jgi:hypothetical protein
LRRTRKTRRDALALVLSTTFHVVILALVAREVVKPYVLPQFAPEPMDVRIVTVPVVTPPPPPPPKIVPPKIQPTPTPPPPPKPAPPKPAPPKPEQAAPQPPKPQTPTPTPPKPEPPKPAPPKLSPLPAPVAPSPRPAPTPRPAATVTHAVSQAPPTPTPGPPKPAPPSPVHAPSPLNVHQPAQAAPLSVPSLPLAPAAGPAGKPGSASGGPPASAPAAGGPTGNATGLRAYPYGVMPNGGPGLRGTLVGCANASAVGLTSQERNRCNERFGVGIARAPVLDPIAPGKRRTFDDAAARQSADQKERDSTSFGGRALSGGGPEPKPAWTPGTPP